MHKAIPGGVPEDLESLLATAYAVEIPADLGARLDRRVRRAVRHWRPQTSARWRLVRPRARRLALIPILLALIPVVLTVLLVTASAGGGPREFYICEGGYEWQHAEQLGLSKTVDGYKITLEWAYADANRMLLGVTVVDTRDRGWRQVDAGGVSVSDGSDGKWTWSEGLTGVATATRAASIFWFDYEPGLAAPGRRGFSVTVSSVSVRDQQYTPPPNDPAWNPWHDVAVNATFSFDLTVGGGSQIAPGVTAESNGITVTLDRIVVSPSTVRIELKMAGLASADAWTPLVWVSHDGKDLGAGDSSGDRFATTVYTPEGVDDPAGDWTVTVDDVKGGGTWTLHFATTPGPESARPPSPRSTPTPATSSTHSTSTPRSAVSIAPRSCP
jgi:hypothetical protein